MEILKRFRTVLLGTRITVFMDHKNLTHEMMKFATQHVLQWHLQLEEYGAKFCYKKGEENVIADALSHVPCQLEGVLMKPDAQWSILDKPALAECLSNYPLRPAGLVADQSNGSLRPTEMVADHTMTQEQ